METIITSNIDKAVEILRSGGLVAFPTETVYGLGADASNLAAVRKVYQAKERPYDHPLIVHIASIEQLSDWAQNVSSDAIKLAQAFWPGPLTMIFKKELNVLDIVTGWQDTIGLRIPRHPVAQRLLQAFGGGIAAPSANKFTHVSATTPASVLEELNGEIDLILEGGECEIGLESTIIDMTQSVPAILRPGMITSLQIEEVLGIPIRSMRQDKPTTVRAPGMHHLHYAPKTKALLIEKKNIPAMLKKLRPQDLPTVCLIHGELLFDEKIDWIKMPDDAQTYAKQLYQTLRSVDNKNYKQIIIETVPEEIEWEAIRDRLFKATQGKIE